MKLPQNIARSILDRQAVIVCRPLTSRNFVSHCKSHGLLISEERLRTFEMLGVFFPIFRIYKPDITMKIERVSGNRHRSLGQLEDDEDWDGETHQEIAQFGFSPRIYKSWIDEKVLWCPRSQKSKHEKTIDTDKERHEAFYSPFQVFELQYVVNRFDMTLHLESCLEEKKDSKFTHDEWREYLRDIATQSLQSEKEPSLPTYQPILAQLISNRYFPQALSDRRTIRVTQGNLEFPGWDWHKCVDEWQPAEILPLMELEPSDIEKMHGQLTSQIEFVDPLARWDDLIGFVSIDKRKLLKHDAMRAELYRRMASMLACFYEDLTGNKVQDRRLRRRVEPTDDDSDLIRELEFVTNSFNLNPRPKLTMIVEGETEEHVFPLIFSKVFGHHNSVSGIEIVNLKGVGNVVGSRKEDRQTAIVRLVDYLHRHQTVCFILLDNEGTADKLRKRLRNARSAYSSGRYVTRQEYLRIWRKCFEFDNFSDTEIAAAMSEQYGTHIFKRRDVAKYRNSIPHGNLEKLFQGKTGRSLDKPKLGEALVEIMVSERSRRKIENRPIIKVIEKVRKLALLNHRPANEDIEEINQVSGYMGKLTKKGRSLRKKNKSK